MITAIRIENIFFILFDLFHKNEKQIRGSLTDLEKGIYEKSKTIDNDFFMTIAAT